VINNRVLTRDNLAKKRKVEDGSCLFCAEKETIQHVFFECVVAKQCWRILSNILEYQVGGNMIDTGKYWLSNKKFCILNMVTSATIWSIWKLKNDLCFQRLGWRSMEMLFFRITGLLRNWMLLCSVDKKVLLDSYINKIKAASKEVGKLLCVN
jgi:hypothetical protein